VICGWANKQVALAKLPVVHERRRARG
jgi:hypothetical protein